MSAMSNFRIPREIEAVDEEMAAVLRQKTGLERWAIAAAMFDSAQALLKSHLRHENPDWPEERVDAEVARRIAHGNF